LRVGTKGKVFGRCGTMRVWHKTALCTHTNTRVRLLPLIAENKMKKWCHCLQNMRLLLLSDGV